MIQYTAPDLLPYPEDSDSPDPPRDFEGLALATQAALMKRAWGGEWSRMTAAPGPLYPADGASKTVTFSASDGKPWADPVSGKFTSPGTGLYLLFADLYMENWTGMFRASIFGTAPSLQDISGQEASRAASYPEGIRLSASGAAFVPGGSFVELHIRNRLSGAVTLRMSFMMVRLS